jgi:very-short-patch-repair endonuclease
MYANSADEDHLIARKNGEGQGWGNQNAMRKGSLSNSPDAIARARDFRKNMTASEQVFWSLVRKEGLGFKFRRQHPVGRFFPDFYCADASLCVEIDGELHDPQTDKIRDLEVAELGVLTIRVPSLDLFDPSGKKVQQWLDEIRYHCELRSRRNPHPQPPPHFPSDE